MAARKIRRLSLSLKRDPAISVTSVAIGDQKLVYVLVADRKIRYEDGKSRIVYIGTTKNGVNRVANSVGFRAEDILGERGVRSFDARIVTCTPRQHVKTWHKLERALILEFRELYGEIPLCNSHGSRIRGTDEFRYFRKARVRDILEELA
jgi:hypothetical protein